MDKFQEGGGGGLSSEEFQGKVMGKLDDIEKANDTSTSKVEDMLKNFENLDTKTKDAFEELTKLKNNNSGLDSDMAQIKQSIAKVNLLVNAEQRASYGSLGKALAADKDRGEAILRTIAPLVDMGKEVSKALGEDSSPGNTVIDDEFHADVYDSLSRFGKWSTLGVRPMGTKESKIPVKTARTTAGFILAEAAEIPDDTNKAGNLVTLEAEVIAVLLNVSKQLIMDGEIDVVADVMDDFIESVNLALDHAVFRGTGAEDYTNGGILGLFNFGTAVTAQAGRTSIGQTKYQDWLKCLTSVNDVVLERPARWWINPTMLAAAIGVEDANGRPIFKTAMEAPSSGMGSIFGFPVSMVSAAPNSDAASGQIAAFGDPRAYAVGMRKKYEFESSDHHRWNTYERSFRGVARADAKGLASDALSVLSLPAS